MRDRVGIWVEAARPKTLIASIAPVVMGCSLAYPNISWIMLCFTLTTSIAIQIGTNYANDYFDGIKGTDTPNRKGPLRITAAGLASFSSMKRAIALTFGTTLLLSSYLIFYGGYWFALLTSCAILLGIGYTAGPLPLAYIGLGDLFVCLFFGPVATMGTYYLQSHQWDSTVALLGLAPGLLSTAMLAVNNLRDVEEDQKNEKKTLCVRFGTTFVKWEYTLCVSGAPLVCAACGHYLPLWILLPALIPIKTIWSDQDPQRLTKALEQTGQILWLFILLFALHAL